MRRLVPRLIGSILLLALVIMGAGPANSADELSVESLLPQGRVDRLTQIVVRFNKNMRSLGDMSQKAEQAPLRISPAPAGSFRWLDPRTLAFILDKPLVGSSRIDLVIPAGAQALDGSRLAKDIKGFVQTPPIEVVRVRPKPGSVLGPKPQLYLTFNQPLDLTPWLATVPWK